MQNLRLQPLIGGSDFSFPTSYGTVEDLLPAIPPLLPPRDHPTAPRANFRLSQHNLLQQAAPYPQNQMQIM